MTDIPLFTTRRDFLVGGLKLLSAAATLPVFLGHTVRVLGAEPPTSQRHKTDSQRILVVVQLAGGNDGLNTVVPYEYDQYYQFRPQIAIPKKDVLRLDQGVGLHPAATGLKALYDAGHLAILQGIGYPNADRSHFVATDIWESADPERHKHDGWLGRYFDACCNGKEPAPEPIQGIALTQEAPLALQGEKFMPVAFSNPDALTWRAGQRDAQAAAVFGKLNNRGTDVPTTRPGEAQFLERAALDALVGADEIRQAATSTLRGKRGGRGGPLAQQLGMVARMIKADLPTRVYYLSISGFDTHTGQLGRQQQLLKQLGDALEDFMATLAEDKLLERVLVMTFSEFGRRVQENASGGTDHGEAAPMFLIGAKLRPGLHGKHPDLANLHRGDLAFECDFRRVYAAVLQHWLGMQPDKVLGAGFGPVDVIKT